MPTVREIEAGFSCSAQCRRCRRRKVLDLHALSARWGATDINALALRCEALVPEHDGPGLYVCGGRAFMWTVVPVRTGPRA
jgi:hypothetical protein